MSSKTVAAKPTPIADRPASGPAALLRAMGLSAVQVAPGIVALQADQRKRAA